MSACWGFSRTFDDNVLRPAITSGRIVGKQEVIQKRAWGNSGLGQHPTADRFSPKPTSSPEQLPDSRLSTAIRKPYDGDEDHLHNAPDRHWSKLIRWISI